MKINCPASYEGKRLNKTFKTLSKQTNDTQQSKVSPMWRKMDGQLNELVSRWTKENNAENELNIVQT